jgi:hypothetical protein
LAKCQQAKSWHFGFRLPSSSKELCFFIAFKMASEDNSRILDELEAFYDRCLREWEVIVPDFEGRELQEGFQFMRADGTPSSLEEIEAELKQSCASKGAQLISRGEIHSVASATADQKSCATHALRAILKGKPHRFLAPVTAYVIAASNNSN